MTTGKALAPMVAVVLLMSSFWSAPARADQPTAVPATAPATVPATSAPPAVSRPAFSPLPATAPELAPVAPQAPPESPADGVLRRVLRSGCHDGTREVEKLAGDPAAPWAETVSRMCGEILRAAEPEDIGATKLRTSPPRPVVQRDTGTHEGRGRLVFWSSLYGLWLGIATDVLFDINGDRTVILPPLLGMGLGMGLSLSLTAGVPLTSGQAWTIITGLDYGTINGALWAGSFDLSSKGVVGTAVASSVAATAIGVAVADAASPSAGDVEVVRSGLLWGAIGGTLALIAFGSDSNISETAALRSIAVCMDAGFLVGLALAKNFDVSRNRALIIDAGALGGGMTGLGITLMALSNPGSNGQAVAGGALAGMITGIAIAALATRDLDTHGDRTAMGGARSPVPALLARDTDGRWRPGTPGPMPVFDGTGHRLVGATLNALGGSF